MDWDNFFVYHYWMACTVMIIIFPLVPPHVVLSEMPREPLDVKTFGAVRHVSMLAC